MKKVFKSIGAFIKKAWPVIIIIILTLLSMLAFVLFGISTYTSPVNYAPDVAYDMWYNGLNINYDSMYINISDNNIDIDSIGDRGISGVDTSKISVSITLEQNTKLRQNGNVITLYHPGILGSEEAYLEIDFSSGEPIVKSKKTDFIFSIIFLVIITIFIGCVALIIWLLLARYIEYVIDKIKDHIKSKL